MNSPVSSHNSNTKQSIPFWVHFTGLISLPSFNQLVLSVWRSWEFFLIINIKMVISSCSFSVNKKLRILPENYPFLLMSKCSSTTSARNIIKLLIFSWSSCTALCAICRQVVVIFHAQISEALSKIDISTLQAKTR